MTSIDRTYVDLIIELEEALISIRYESTATPFKLLIVMVTVPLEFIVVGLKLTVEPTGSPVVEKLTFSEKPFIKSNAIA